MGETKPMNQQQTQRFNRQQPKSLGAGGGGCLNCQFEVSLATCTHESSHLVKMYNISTGALFFDVDFQW